VKIYVVFSHELVELDVLRIEPPFPPFGIKRRGYAWIPERSIELPASKLEAGDFGIPFARGTHPNVLIDSGVSKGIAQE
jgi:hypothetical protein